jgi:hypothetical protein
MTKIQDEQKVNWSLTMRSPILTNGFHHESLRRHILGGRPAEVCRWTATVSCCFFKRPRIDQHTRNQSVAPLGKYRSGKHQGEKIKDLEYGRTDVANAQVAKTSDFGFKLEEI